ncbi:MAG: TonB-dependent receptor [Henriciella sp.]|uniref:TonB-dependent receptor plug domain-containing protein n=1 Tax=Henriciella sp. TaxID=1968823 RepID=UPI003C749283
MRQASLRAIAIAGLMSLAAMPSAIAQSEALQTEDEEATMESVLVTGTQLEEDLAIELSEYGNRLQIIDSEDLVKRAIGDVATALQLLAPSLYIQPKAGAFDYVDISLEGSRTSEVLWLIDGVRISNRLYNGTTPLDTIPAAMVERIEILEGGQGLFYGTQSVAGVVNVITKSLKSGETDGQFMAGVDTNGGEHISGNVRGAAGPHEFVFFASSDTSEGYQPIPTEDYQPSATDRERGYDVLTMGAKYGIDITPDMRFSANYQNTKARLDFARPDLINLYYNERDEDIISAKLDWEATDTFGVYLKGYYHSWDTTIDRYNNSLTDPGEVIQTADNVYWGYEDFGLNILSKFAPGNGIEVYAGWDYQNYNGRDDVLLIDEQTESVHAPFVQLRTTEDMFGKLKLAIGARHNMPKSGEGITIWNASGQYDFSEFLFARATFGTSYRLPDAYELFAIDPCCTQGNPDLKGEESTNFNGSVGGFFPLGGNDGSWEIVGYYREVDDLIASAPGAGGQRVFQNSDGKTEVTGGLVAITLPFTDAFSADASFGFTEAEGSNGQQIDSVPESTAKLGVSYDPESLPIGGSLNFNYFGTTYDTLGVGRQEYGDTLTVDLSAFFTFGPEDRHRITGRVQNLFDEEYVTRFQQVTPDGGGDPYAARFVGVPQTLYVKYGYSF